MEEEVELLVMETQENMQNAIDHFKSELLKIRAGKASPDMLNGVMVEAYGATTQLNALATVNVPDARSMAIQPFDRNTIGNIERAIINSNLGFNPSNDGTIIRILIPPLTEERRHQLVKMAKAAMETAKISVRNARKDANEAIKKMVKDGLSEDRGKDIEADIQDTTHDFNKKIEEFFEQKEKDIMTI